MKSATVGGDADVETRVVVLESGEEAFSTLTEFANDAGVKAASLTAIGAFANATVGWLDFEKKTYRKIEIAEQCEVLSAIGDVEVGDDGKASLHVHVVLGLSDGTTRGGHLLQGQVRATLEVVFTDTPAKLRRKKRADIGIARYWLTLGAFTAFFARLAMGHAGVAPFVCSDLVGYRMTECDVAIIGAGTAGLAAERSARRAGAKTLLIDDRFAGTTCTTVGCMPSKLLIAAALSAHAVRQAPLFGIKAAEPKIDGPAIMRRLRKERDAFVAATIESIEKVPAENRIKARARFADRRRLALDDGNSVSAKAVVIATGSRPRVPKMFEPLGDRVLTNETIFELSDLPRSVAVVGAGPLGLELAQALARLGVETEVFDEGKRLAGLHDEDVALELESILANELPIHLGVSLSVKIEGDGAEISWKGASAGKGHFKRVLIAAGRPPDLRGLHLEATGLALDEHGIPKFDPETLQCGDAPIFICGDADAQRPVLHEASAEGIIAGRNAGTFPTVHRTKRNLFFSIMSRIHRLPSWEVLPREERRSAARRTPTRGARKWKRATRGLSGCTRNDRTENWWERRWWAPAWTTLVISWCGPSSRARPRARCFATPLKSALREICELSPGAAGTVAPRWHSAAGGTGVEGIAGVCDCAEADGMPPASAANMPPVRNNDRMGVPRYDAFGTD
jgi:dihydrolipoamide dehydrogenase